MRTKSDQELRLLAIENAIKSGAKVIDVMKMADLILQFYKGTYNANPS